MKRPRIKTAVAFTSDKGKARVPITELAFRKETVTRIVASHSGHQKSQFIINN